MIGIKEKHLHCMVAQYQTHSSFHWIEVCFKIIFSLLFEICMFEYLSFIREQDGKYNYYC